MPNWNDPLVDSNFCRVHFIDEVKKAVEIMKKGKMEEAQKIVKDLSTLFE